MKLVVTAEMSKCFEETWVWVKRTPNSVLKVITKRRRNISNHCNDEFWMSSLSVKVSRWHTYTCTCILRFCSIKNDYRTLCHSMDLIRTVLSSWTTVQFTMLMVLLLWCKKFGLLYTVVFKTEILNEEPWNLKRTPLVTYCFGSISIDFSRWCEKLDIFNWFVWLISITLLIVMNDNWITEEKHACCWQSTIGKSVILNWIKNYDLLLIKFIKRQKHCSRKAFG